ncbi:SPOR domain-containing protein [Sphingomonas nostoxanthinifaciens]|uniref:SPOR domain-containing protein n=1 Tax=Sphingomonas nostoxanthinifaciens TaxID=2872652 RepID=UPI0021DA6AF0|nr:SPOR domain-containing protein [Sphingomonas nostoxanthinifaciens]UAK24821.1 SPOR domain-containing protein [Sphingomonas nostoxanthinifaciens]
MAEIRRGLGGEGLGNERLPWLEPVEDEDDYAEGGNFGGIALIGLGLLVAIALIVAAVMLFRHWQASHADLGKIIHAPTTPYKVKPVNPGGLTVDGSGAVAEKTGTGGDIDAPLDLAAIPEQPVAGPGSGQAPAAPHATATVPARPAAAAPVPTMANPVPAPAQPAPPLPRLVPKPVPVVPPAATATEKPAPVIGGGTIQLGALNSEAKARSVWKSLSSRFGFLAPLAMSITPVQVGDKTLYRLRASGGDARSLCARLKIAGEVCTVVTG